jgi:ERCC4-related helicase
MFTHCCTEEESGRLKNPKLEKLKAEITKQYRANEDTKGIVFVKTRNLATAMVRWMNECQHLKTLTPGKCLGAQASREKGGEITRVMLSHFARQNNDLVYTFKR